MFVKDRESGDYVEILDLQALVDPFKESVLGRFHVGEEMQDAQEFAKIELVFPSGESLPKCWLDPHYKSAY